MTIAWQECMAWAVGGDEVDRKGEQREHKWSIVLFQNTLYSEKEGEEVGEQWIDPYMNGGPHNNNGNLPELSLH